MVANRALRLGLIEYDRRHGYRGALRNVPISANAVPRQLEGLLGSLPPVGNLQSAVVVSVAPTAARVYVRGTGFAQIDAEGVAWARGRNGGSKVDDIVHRGDLIYVLSNGQGTAQLGQIPEAQGALVALDPQDGAIAALIGGFDYFSNAYNRVTQAHRQPGSGFKPFLYSAALEHGFTPASVIMDAPIVVADQGVEQTWRPENDGGTFSGPTRLREALVHSRNLVSIRLLRAVGAADVIDYAARFGFERASMPNNLTLALGTLTATPLQVATGYTAFANGGYKIEPYFIERIENAVGETVWRAQPAVACAACETAEAAAAELTPDADSPGGTVAAGITPLSAAPVDVPANSRLTMAPPLAERLAPLLPEARHATRIITAANAWLMDDLMADVIKRGTGRRALVLGRNDLSGKTGTTNESRNTWFNGFNQNLEATVWVGFDQERPLGEGEEGSSVAVPIWVRLMREGLRGVPDVPRAVPPGLVTARVNALSGLLAPVGDSNTVFEYFFADRLPAVGNAANTPDNGSGEPLF
jgi:penicillin-binding protein 1A